VLYKALEQPNPELQEAGFECMKKFIAGFQIDMEMVSTQNWTTEKKEACSGPS
jgi:transformation/transcription domain-associated protein